MQSNTMPSNEKTALWVIGILSVAIPAVVALLMYMPREGTTIENSFASVQPLFHAILNGATAIALAIGFYFIKNKKITQHKASMLAAFVFSAIFLVSYVVYHYTVPSSKYGGEGAMRGIYFFVLITHILLAGGIVPLALLTLYRAFTNQIGKHRKIAKITFPIWMYVALTGVLVYLMMRPYYTF